MFGFILLGSFFMIIGLYAANWAKVKDLGEIKPDTVVQLLQESFRKHEY